MTTKPKFTLTPHAGTGPSYKPDYVPGVQDYAAPSVYQSNSPYSNSGINQTNPARNTPPVTTPPPVVQPSTSSFAPAAQMQQQTMQPLMANSTGQFGVAAGANPFNTVQNSQQSTTTGDAALKTVINSSTGKKPTPAKKKLSDLDKYLGKDSDYQNTLRDLTRALADFKARQGVEKTRAGTEYGYAQRTMGNQKDQDLGDIENDAAARGIVTSGVYGTRVGDYNTVYNEQLGELGRQYNSQLEDFASALRDFSRQQDLQKESARTAAIRRRSAKLGKVS